MFKYSHHVKCSLSSSTPHFSMQNSASISLFLLKFDLIGFISLLMLNINLWSSILRFNGCDNEEEEDACIVSQTQTSRTLHLKDKTILANSAITASSIRRRLLSICKSVKIWSEPEVWKTYLSFLPAKLWNKWQDWEAYWNSHHMIRNLHNLSQQQTTRYRKLVTWTSLYEQTLNFQCIVQSVLIAS